MEDLNDIETQRQQQGPQSSPQEFMHLLEQKTQYQMMLNEYNQFVEKFKRSQEELGTQQSTI